MRIVVMLKTAEGGRWIVPQVEELRRRGHEVIVVLPAGPGRLRDLLQRGGVSMVDSPFRFRFRPGIATLVQLWRLRRLIRRLRPDVLQYHHYHAALAARLGTLGLGIARVFMVPGPLFLESRLIRASERFLVRLDDVVIAGSGCTAARYRSLGRADRSLPVVPYGVDTRAFRPPDVATRLAARRRLELPDDVFVAIMVAYVYAPKTLVHRGTGIKGHDVLLEAWRTFHRDRPQSRLILVGAGWDAAGEDHRQALIRRFDIAGDPSVDWYAGVVDVSRYYAAANVSVSPSLSENHGAALEAGAVAVPSIVSDAGGLPETVAPDSGWVVPAGDVDSLVAALHSAYAEFRSGGLRRRGMAARELVEQRFDSGDCARAVADVIEVTGGLHPVSRRRRRLAGSATG
ncbi:glycosyltransferase family 4 protein [Solwaraspora sp. WMMD791]|uniref:glycosyltransferase family 4 protein n=1 Tax=Solwaraspora sp. WMMD791 TaxID=3016086 RepID=UPI00249B5880|nr:glycosyltransferase family 4 protein [Solwaraspora sp. WMMD791]WFE28429.1 glycosyltransferase family 4 protein [Solwaraspora sp. WMMD791]